MILDRVPQYLHRTVDLICLGRTNKQIAAELGVSENRVKNSMRELFDRVGCDSRLQLANLVTQERMQ